MINEINYIFNIGFRCNSVDFLKKYNLHKISSPFDHLFIDFETSLDIISNKMECFYSDIILFNKNNNILELKNHQNTKVINDKFGTLMKNDIFYMAHNYNKNNLLFNQNFINNVNGNLYNFDRIMQFHHSEDKEYLIFEDKISNRSNRFINIYSENKERTILFYMTKIISISTSEYIKFIINNKNKYNIKSFIVVVICSDNDIDGHIYDNENNCLFIIKSVENYYIQLSKYETDNNINVYNFDNVYNIMLKYFNFNLK